MTTVSVCSIYKMDTALQRFNNSDKISSTFQISLETYFQIEVTGCMY